MPYGSASVAQSASHARLVEKRQGRDLKSFTGITMRVSTFQRRTRPSARDATRMRTQLRRPAVIVHLCQTLLMREPIGGSRSKLQTPVEADNIVCLETTRYTTRKRWTRLPSICPLDIYSNIHIRFAITTIISSSKCLWPAQNMSCTWRRAERVLASAKRQLHAPSVVLWGRDTENTWNETD
jgi:hypothetical protein